MAEEKVNESKVGMIDVKRGGDLAADLLAERFTNEPPYDREEELKLRFKLDMRLIPFLFLNITLPAMDKVTPATGALYGLREDLGLKGDEYAWVGSAFYVSICQRLDDLPLVCQC